MKNKIKIKSEIKTNTHSDDKEAYLKTVTKPQIRLKN